MSTKKTQKKEEGMKAETPGFTEFKIRLGGDEEPTVVPVVATLDELPRADRRELRDLMFNARILAGSANKMNVAAVTRAFAVRYCASQGVHIDVDDESAPVVEQDRIDDELRAIGTLLYGHFNKATGDEGKANAEVEASEAGES